MYEPRGDEGYNSLQEMPLPGSISGMESELASSETEQVAFVAPEAPAEVRPKSTVPTTLVFPLGE